MLPSAFLTLFAIFAQANLSSSASSSSSSPSSSSSESNKKPPTFRTITIHFDKDVQVCTNVCLSICNDGDKTSHNEIPALENLKTDAVPANSSSDQREVEENEFEVINKMPKNFRIASGMIREADSDTDDVIMTSSEEKPGPPILERLILQDDRVGDSGPSTTTATVSMTTTTVPDSSETTSSSDKAATITPAAITTTAANDPSASPNATTDSATTTVASGASDNSTITTTTPDPDSESVNATMTPGNLTMTTAAAVNETSMTTMSPMNGAAFRSDANATSNSTQGQADDGFDADDAQNETKPAAGVPVTQQKNKDKELVSKGVTPGPASQSSSNPDIDIVMPIINSGIKGGIKGGGGLARASSVKSGKKFRSPSAAARQRSLNRVKKEDRPFASGTSTNRSRRRRKNHGEGNNIRRRSRNSSRVRVSNKRKNGNQRRTLPSTQNQGENQSSSRSRNTWSMEPLPDSHDPGYADVPYRASTLSRRYVRPPQRYSSSYFVVNHSQG